MGVGEEARTGRGEGQGWGRGRGGGREAGDGDECGQELGGGTGGKKGAEEEPALWGRQVDTDPGGCQGGGSTG